MSEARKLVDSVFADLADGPCANAYLNRLERCIDAVASALDAARIEGAAAENARCAEIARKCRTEFTGSPDIIEAAQFGCDHVEVSILASSPIPDFAQRIRDEALEEAAKDIETWGASDDEPTDPDVAFSCLAAAIRAKKAARTGGHQ